MTELDICGNGFKMAIQSGYGLNLQQNEVFSYIRFGTGADVDQLMCESLGLLFDGILR